jgi:hypothetical protein
VSLNDVDYDNLYSPNAPPHRPSDVYDGEEDEEEEDWEDQEEEDWEDEEFGEVEDRDDDPFIYNVSTDSESGDDSASTDSDN